MTNYRYEFWQKDILNLYKLELKPRQREAIIQAYAREPIFNENPDITIATGGVRVHFNGEYGHFDTARFASLSVGGDVIDIEKSTDWDVENTNRRRL